MDIRLFQDRLSWRVILLQRPHRLNPQQREINLGPVLEAAPDALAAKDSQHPLVDAGAKFGE
jgi:hypothetical protein